MVKKDAVSNKAKKRLKKEEELLESSWKLANNMYKGIWNDRWDSIKESILTKQNELEVLNAYSDASFAVKDAKSVESWKKYKSGFQIVKGVPSNFGQNEFYFRRLKNSIVEARKAAGIPLIFDHLN